MTILQVPYKSQITGAATYSNNDCGPACVAMMLAGMGHDVTIDSLYTHPSSVIQGMTGLISVQTIQTLAQSYGMPLQRKNVTLDELKRLLDSGRPSLLLVDYRPVVVAGLNGTPTQGNYGHFVVAVGYDDNSFLIHDPYWKDQGGAYRHWPNDVFNKSFRGGPGSSGNNYQGACLVPVNSIAQPQTPAAPAFPMDESVARRIRAKALFEKQAVPQISNQSEYDQAVAWLGEWGHMAEPYFIQPGDTLGKVAARRFGSTDFAMGLAAYNGINDPNSLAVGQKILLPLPAQGGATPPPPPAAAAAAPAPATAYTFTNQQVINAFNETYKSRGAGPDDYWHAIVGADIEEIANFRAAVYTGPAISSLAGIPDDIKAAIAARLGVAG